MLFYSNRKRRYYDDARARATAMRNNPTQAEAKMYRILHSVVSMYPEHKFYRQSVKFSKLGYYILDFYCPTLNLGIEVDGSIHDNREKYDENRDAILANNNIQVFRFSNYDVLYDAQSVASRLCEIVEEKASSRGFIAAPSYRTDTGLIVREKTNSKSNCFIATAAYGTPMAQEINILRQFRDTSLESNLLGRNLVTVYYNISPPIAKIIVRNKKMREFVRFFLTPIVRFFESRKKYTQHSIPSPSSKSSSETKPTATEPKFRKRPSIN